MKTPSTTSRKQELRHMVKAYQSFDNGKLLELSQGYGGEQSKS